MALKEAAAGSGVGRPRSVAGLALLRGQAAVQRLRAVVFPRARSTAAHARRAAAKGAAGSRLGERRGQGEERTTEKRQDNAPVQHGSRPLTRLQLLGIAVPMNMVRSPPGGSARFGISPWPDRGWVAPLLDRLSFRTQIT